MIIDSEFQIRKSYCLMIPNYYDNLLNLTTNPQLTIIITTINYENNQNIQNKVHLWYSN